jgi:hypothetical protein
LAECGLGNANRKCQASAAELAFGDATADFAVQVAESAEKAAGVQINEAVLPLKQKRLLLMHGRAVRTAAGSPLSLAKIGRQIRFRVM